MRSGRGARPAILPMTLPGQAIGWSWRAKSTPAVRAVTATVAPSGSTISATVSPSATRSPRPGAVEDEARRRGDHLLHRLEGGGVAGEGGQGGRRAAEDAAAGEEAEERAGVVLGEAGVDVVVGAELDGGGEAGGRDRRLGEAAGQRPPGAAAGLVEGIAAGDLGEEHGAGAELGREVGGAGPERRAEVEVEDRLVVGVQVEHEVGVVGEAEEEVAQDGDLALRLHGGERVAPSPGGWRRRWRRRPLPAVRRAPGPRLPRGRHSRG